MKSAILEQINSFQTYEGIDDPKLRALAKECYSLFYEVLQLSMQSSMPAHALSELSKRSLKDSESFFNEFEKLLDRINALYLSSELSDEQLFKELQARKLALEKASYLLGVDQDLYEKVSSFIKQHSDCDFAQLALVWKNTEDYPEDNHQQFLKDFFFSVKCEEIRESDQFAHENEFVEFELKQDERINTIYLKNEGAVASLLTALRALREIRNSLSLDKSTKRY